jgi:hypothetical protein
MYIAAYMKLSQLEFAQSQDQVITDNISHLENLGS